ncbi:hypothetical protein Pla163_11020 [Planctomycetes bacterium Pla163]|uniref:Uncharacterized protein n=1 Tax=Rohdeia mirabilis TaxID=2528008 RepID=A0A518CXP5_9BACT|nr:hypothetical protein Pla163_11020 [Planctomycetes bacterium Pla163]
MAPALLCGSNPTSNSNPLRHLLEQLADPRNPWT